MLGSRPHTSIEGQYSWELFRRLAPDTEKIRVWMRTAVLGKVTSYRGLLNTLLHGFCHHLDVRSLGFTNTPHTRGFFWRIDHLYHLALDTPPRSGGPLRVDQVGERLAGRLAQAEVGARPLPAAQGFVTSSRPTRRRRRRRQRGRHGRDSMLTMRTATIVHAIADADADAYADAIRASKM